MNNYSNELAIVRGDKYRFTVLTPELIRLEYQEEGVFENVSNACQYDLYCSMCFVMCKSKVEYEGCIFGRGTGRLLCDSRKKWCKYFD